MVDATAAERLSRIEGTVQRPPSEELPALHRAPERGPELPRDRQWRPWPHRTTKHWIKLSRTQVVKIIRIYLGYDAICRFVSRKSARRYGLAGLGSSPP